MHTFDLASQVSHEVTQLVSTVQVVIVTGYPQVFHISELIGLLLWIFWKFWAPDHPNQLRIDWVMIQNWFEANSFKNDVTGGANVMKNNQKTRNRPAGGFGVIFGHIWTYCDISFEAIDLKSILDHNSVNS